jgi:hypothetical protein
MNGRENSDRNTTRASIEAQERRASAATRQRRAAKRGNQPQSNVEELPLWPHTVQGRGLVKILQNHVVQLRNEKVHGNRQLHLDDVVVTYLLAFYNPSIRSLRTIEDFSQTRQAQKCLSIPRLCKSTLSDFNALVDPERLQPIIAALREPLTGRRLNHPLPNDLEQVLQQVIAVDGTFLPALADVAWAVSSRNQHENQKYRARLDWQVDVRTWIPELVAVPDRGQSEAEVAATAIRPGAIHVYDRGFQSLELMKAHYSVEGDSVCPYADFVARLREEGSNALKLTTVQQQPLSETAAEAGVVGDRLVQVPGLKKKHGIDPVLREVVVALPEGGPLRLLTTLCDVPAEVIALIYQRRWQIELFFRWLKCCANFTHLISHSRGGVLLNFYVAIIGIMLMYLQMNARPSKYMFSLLGVVASGGATLEEIAPILRERERQSAVARASAAERRAKKRTASQ